MFYNSKHNQSVFLFSRPPIRTQTLNSILSITTQPSEIYWGRAVFQPLKGKWLTNAFGLGVKENRLTKDTNCILKSTLNGFLWIYG